jgi:hypothetical protein
LFKVGKYNYCSKNKNLIVLIAVQGVIVLLVFLRFMGVPKGSGFPLYLPAGRQVFFEKNKKGCRLNP